MPEPIDLGPVGVPQMALTMAVSTRVSGQTPANWKAWYEQTQCPSRSFCTRWPIAGSFLTSAWFCRSLSEIGNVKATTSKCQVLVLDTSGFKWKEAFAKVKTKDGRQIEVHHSAWHLINVAATSHFGGCAVVDVLKVGAGGMGHHRIIPDCVLVRDSCRQVRIVLFPTSCCCCACCRSDAELSPAVRR